MSMYSVVPLHATHNATPTRPAARSRFRRMRRRTVKTRPFMPVPQTGQAPSDSRVLLAAVSELPPSEMQEAEEEIREIKKEIIESRGLIIKTNNLVNSLGADVKAIAKRQSSYERRFNWNGGVFLGVVAVISFAGLKLASDARIREIESEVRELNRQKKELTRELDQETERADDRARAETKASQFYSLIRQQKREQVVERYDALSKETLSGAERAFFRDTYDSFRLDLSILSYQNGLELMRTGRYAEAAEQFRESFRLRDDAAHIPAVKYQLARALRKLDRQSEAMVYARQVVAQKLDRELQDDAMYLVGLCAEELDDIDTAREAVRTLIRRWPRSSIARDARIKLRDLNRRALRGHQAAADAPEQS